MHIFVIEHIPCSNVNGNVISVLGNLAFNVWMRNMVSFSALFLLVGSFHPRIFIHSNSEKQNRFLYFVAVEPVFFLGFLSFHFEFHFFDKRIEKIALVDPFKSFRPLFGLY